MLNGSLPIIVVPNLLYLGIAPQAWMVLAGFASAFPQLSCTNEKADDRMMFHMHVQDMSSRHLGCTPMTL